MPKLPLYLIPLLPLCGAALNLIVGRKLPRRWVHGIALLAVGASCVVAAATVFGPLWTAWSAYRQGHAAPAEAAVHEQVWLWIQSGGLRIDLAFTVDALSGVMILVVTFVGFLIHLFSTGYMAEEPRYAAYFGYLNLFTGAMLVLVLGDSLPVMFIGWEGVGLCSYLLIGFWFENDAYAYAGRKAFVVNRIGDFAFLLGIFLLFWGGGTLQFSQLGGAGERLGQELVFGQSTGTVAAILLFIGACGKSAQIPLYVWLPDAMAGPTPVSALIHAATMVTAGVYMVARLSFLYAASPLAMAIVAGVGAATALVASLIAFAQTDLKKVLAYSTVSQLGFMFVAVGCGAHTAGIFHLVTHAFFKAGLFLAAGSVMHAMSGSGDIRTMGGLRSRLPITHVCFLVYCLAIAGIFPLSGFFSKDEILLGAFSTEPGWWPLYGKLLWGALSLAALGTAFYMFRLYFLVFAGECRADEETQHHIHESPWTMWLPLVVLAAFTCGLGALGLPHLEGMHLPTLFADWLAPAVTQVEEHASSALTLGLMGVALAAGLGGIGLAFALYKSGPSAQVDSLTRSGLGGALHRAVANKLYVDEIYDFIIVKPFRALATLLFDIVDRILIDLILVGGGAAIVDLVGRIPRWFQNGQVQRYLVAMLIGGAAIFYLAGRSQVDFGWAGEGTEVAFHAELGAGPGGAGARLRWDFDGDGKVDTVKERQPRWSYAHPGRYQVTLWVDDPIFGKSTTVRHTIDVRGGGL